MGQHVVIHAFSFSLLLQAVQILNGAVILALGGFMHSVQNLSHPSSYFFFSVVYTGYSTWGAIFVSSQIPLTEYHFLAAATRNVLGQLFPHVLGVAW